PLNKIIIIAGLFIALLILLKFVFRGSRKIKIIILVLLLLLFAFFIIIYKKRTQHLLNITKNIIFSDYDSKNIYFVKLLKNKEYAEEIIKDINQAKDSIYISMYLIEINKNPYNLSNKIIEALCSAAQRNVKIFVMLDLPAKGENPDLLKKNTVVKKKLESNNIKVIWDSPNNENHEKIVLIDEKIMYIGNHNWSIASLEYNEEISLKITSYRFTADILNYFFNIFAETQENIKELSEVSLLQKELISSDNLKETGAQSTENFAGAAEELENQNIFEREDLIKVTDLQFLPGYMYYFKLRKELAAAESSVYINMFLLRYVNANIKDPVYNLLEILNELNSKGVKIKIVLDRMLEEENKIVYNFLNERKIPVEFYNGNNTMHTKLVVIDGKKIFCGSHNWTNSAFNSNREVSVYLESPEITEQLNINF
ncbi:MAG TPA: phospholipase D-like domain-containing protein, partial [bacterium]|nr:phospholipase D-like domain-containing protein [bacterium]